MFIGLISDTHGVFAEDVRAFLEPVDMIWHAGDFGTLDCARKIAAFKPLTGVYGNCDGQDVRMEYPNYQFFTCEGLKVLMTHIGIQKGSCWAFTPRRLRYDPLAEELIRQYRPDLFVCGHTHIPQVLSDRREGFLLMNPGTCGYQGPTEVPRMALRFHVDNGVVTGLEKIELEG